MIRDRAGLAAFLEGVESVPEHLLKEWTTRLRSGERGNKADGLARKIIRDFELRQLLGREQSQTTLRWLADVLASIVDDHADPRLALGLLKRAKNRPAGLAAQQAFEVHMWVRLAEGRGYSETEAKELAAARFGKDTKTIERYKKAASTWANGVIPDSDGEDYFLTSKPPRPLPPRRDKK